MRGFECSYIWIETIEMDGTIEPSSWRGYFFSWEFIDVFIRLWWCNDKSRIRKVQTRMAYEMIFSIELAVMTKWRGGCGFIFCCVACCRCVVVWWCWAWWSRKCQLCEVVIVIEEEGIGVSCLTQYRVIILIKSDIAFLREAFEDGYCLE